jgi:RNA recognition motif-containing protein
MAMVDYTNLYIKNLDPEVTSYDLFKRFRFYGKIISARVMKDPVSGVSKGYGFVSFTHMEEANEALQQMNGALVNTKNIVVTFHTHKKQLNNNNNKQSKHRSVDLIHLSPPSSASTIVPQQPQPQPQQQYMYPTQQPSPPYPPHHHPSYGFSTSDIPTKVKYIYKKKKKKNQTKKKKKKKKKKLMDFFLSLLLLLLLRISSLKITLGMKRVFGDIITIRVLFCLITLILLLRCMCPVMYKHPMHLLWCHLLLVHLNINLI